MFCIQTVNYLDPVKSMQEKFIFETDNVRNMVTIQSSDSLRSTSESS